MLVTDISMVLNALDFRVLETHSHFKTRPCTAQNLSFKKEFCLREIKKNRFHIYGFALCFASNKRPL